MGLTFTQVGTKLQYQRLGFRCDLISNCTLAMYFILHYRVNPQNARATGTANTKGSTPKP